MTDDALTSRANVVLHLDNGAEMQFSGRPFAGGSWFDDETGELTRQKLYTTESGEHVYSIVTGKGQQRSRRAYRVSLHGEACTINDGRTEMTLDLEMLMLAVRASPALVDAPTTHGARASAANCCKDWGGEATAPEKAFPLLLSKAF